MAEFNFLNFYNLPGEGIVAEFDNGMESVLFDVKGLQYRIIENKKQGLDTSNEENILSKMKGLHPHTVLPFENKYI